MRLRYWIVLVLVFLMSACSSKKDWRGETPKVLFKKLGYPTRVARLPKGKHLLIYAGKKAGCEILFTINQNNHIVSVHYRGGEKCA